MDVIRGVKRPRSSTPGEAETSNKKKDKDKTKKKKKSKPNLKKPPTDTTAANTNNTNDDNTNSLESTATADGQYMAKILSTFSKMEQSRFEAFKRVSFPCNAIRDYVAHCLAERQQQQRHVPPRGNQVFAATGPPQLADLVVPGQDEEITIVVTTLAKAYAQRLVAAAKQVQQQQQQSASSTAAGYAASAGAGGDTTSGSAAALQPEHVLQAYYARTQQGQDPGFFLQPNELTLAPNPQSEAKEQMKRVAALSAQEELDRAMEEYKVLYEKQQQQPPPPKEEGKSGDAIDAAMKNEESDSGDEEEMELDLAKEMEKA